MMAKFKPGNKGKIVKAYNKDSNRTITAECVILSGPWLSKDHGLSDKYCYEIRWSNDGVVEKGHCTEDYIEPIVDEPEKESFEAFCAKVQWFPPKKVSA